MARTHGIIGNNRWYWQEHTDQWYIEENDASSSCSFVVHVKIDRHHCFVQFQGLCHAFTLSHTVKTLICLHSTLEVSIKPECMLVLYRYTELLKVIEMTYHRHAMAIAPYFNAIMQFHSQRLLKIIAIAKVECTGTTSTRSYVVILDVYSN
jgi:hypothetical protein